jgi:hypothetical protein
MELNRHLFTETGTGTGSINVLGTVVHQFQKSGLYRIEFLRKGEYIDNTTLVVEEGAPIHASIDIAEFVSGGSIPERGRDRSCCCDDEVDFRIRPEGYVSFYVSSGPGGYAVTAAQFDQQDDQRATKFDSRELGESDRFAVLLLRPGRYIMVDRNSDTEGQIVVTYPERRDRGQRMPDTKTIRLTDDGFDPKEVKVVPGQGLVFEFKRAKPGQIHVELREPHKRARDDVDDGPQRSWKRPGPRQPDHPVDPDNLDVTELQEELKEVRSPGTLKRLLRMEKTGKNRGDAKQAIARRLREVQKRK